MTTIMPLMYVFFGLSFSIGVSIYIIATNVAMITQGLVSGQSKLSYLTGKRDDPATTPSVLTKVEGRKVSKNATPSKPKSISDGKNKPTTQKTGSKAK